MHISMATCHYLQLYLWVSFSDHGGGVVKMELHLLTKTKLKKNKTGKERCHHYHHHHHSFSSSGLGLGLGEACDYCHHPMCWASEVLSSALSLLHPSKNRDVRNNLMTMFQHCSELFVSSTNAPRKGP